MQNLFLEVKLAFLVMPNKSDGACCAAQKSRGYEIEARCAWLDAEKRSPLR